MKLDQAQTELRHSCSHGIVKQGRRGGCKAYRRATSLAAVILTLGVSAPASAQSTDQYTETVPTAGGGSAPTASEEQTSSLPPSVVDDIDQAGPDARALKRVATSSLYGAPRTAGAREAGDPESPAAASAQPSALSAGASAVTDEGEGLRLVGLLVVMVLTGAIAFFAGMRRHRRGAPQNLVRR